MREYTQALTELAALPRRLDERLAHGRREVDAERKRREAEIERLAREHEEVVGRLESVLTRAREEGLTSRRGEGSGFAGASGSDPLEYARQLVGRLEEALTHVLYTRDALAAEEARLSEEERQRLSEERRRREREELRRREEWEKARQGSVWLWVAAAIAAAAGLAAGMTGTVGLAVPPLAAFCCFCLARGVASTLPALAVQRATGTPPRSPAAPPREANLAALAFAGLGLAAAAAGTATTAVVAGTSSAAVGALALLGGGVVVGILVWLLLPERSQLSVPK